MIRGVLFDLSGVLYTGQTAVPGAVDAMARLQRSRLVIRFVTNTSRRSRQQLCEDLARLGFEIPSASLFSAPMAAKAWIRARGLRPYCLIHPDLEPDFSDLNQSQPNAVLLGDAADVFDYAHLNRAFALCLAGAPLVAMGCNRYFKLGDSLHLDAGPFVKALEYAAMTRAEVVGKPATAFFQAVIASTGLPPDQLLMIGDDVFGDIEGARTAGMTGWLVQTGKYRPGDEQRLATTVPCQPSVVTAIEQLLG